jgi:hypothetical protein
MTFFPTLFGHVEIRVDSRDPRRARRRPIVMSGR